MQLKKIQQNLFDQIPKRGRPAKRPRGHFGGSYFQNYNPKGQRPMDTKKALHLVLRSSKAIGPRSFKHEKHEARVWQIISTHARAAGVRIYEYANAGNHLHLLIKAGRRDDYRKFIRTITGLIARQVMNAERGRSRQNAKGLEQDSTDINMAKEKFWDARPFSRVVSFARKEFRAVKKYLLRNTLEAIGWIPYISRDRRLPTQYKILLGLSG